MKLRFWAGAHADAHEQAEAAEANNDEHSVRERAVPVRTPGLIAFTAVLVAFMVGLSLGSPAVTRLDSRPVPTRVKVAETRSRLPGDKLSSYRGLGSWIDYIDQGPWAHPYETIRAMKDLGVDTIFVQTSTYGLDQGLIHPPLLSAFIEEAHRHGIYVVAWYVPSFRKVDVDVERSMAAIDYRTPSGQAFDSFALDIEAPLVRDIATRNARLLKISRRIRDAAGPRYPLGAIIPDPVGSRYWPAFPYRELTDLYDVFVPMGYFTYRARGFDSVRAYTAANIAKIRAETGDDDVPIHAIGGIAGDTGPHDTRGFVRAVTDGRVLGGSYYDYPITSDREWDALSPLSRRRGKGRG